jgi:integrase/recombinase XerD
MNFRVAIVLRKDKLNKIGACPINIRLTFRRKVQYFATTYVVQENEWDAVKSKVVKSKAWSHLESPDRMNFNINSEYNRIYRMVENALADNPNLNFSQLKAQIKGERNLTFDFYELAQEIIDRYRSNNSFGTYDKCMSYVRKLKQFAPRLDIHTIDLNFINKYEDYLRNGPKYELRKNSIKNSPNTIHSNLKFIRQVMNEAVNQDLISNSENPFSKKVLVTAKTSRPFLTQNELLKLKGLELKDENLQKARDMFLFACYTGGIRVSDLLILKVGDFTDSHVSFKVRKTKDQMRIWLTDISKFIFAKYSENKTSDMLLFDFISNDCDLSSEYSIDRAISSATTKYNKYLKKIAEQAEINKVLSSHIARHTFATTALTLGVDIYAVSKILGHASVKQTEVYSKIVNEHLDNAMGKLNME